MEIISYLTTKPITLLMEIVFMIFGRLYDTGIVVLFVCFFVNLFLVPLFSLLDSKATNCFVEDGSEKSKVSVKKWGYLILDVFLHILYFFAGYAFFTDVEVLRGANLFFIKDLSRPDGIIHAENVFVNLLPFVFYAIIALTAFLSEKKNLFRKIFILAGYFALSLGLYFAPSGLNIFFLFFAIFILIEELLSPAIKKKMKPLKIEGKEDYFLFFSGIIYLILFTGMFIPTNIIKVSPAEFVNVLDVKNPMHYVFYTTLFAIGTFGGWISAYYLLAGREVKVILDRAVWIICCMAFVNYMVAGSSMGEVSPALFYFEFEEFTTLRIVLGYLISILIAVLVCLLIARKKEILKIIIAVEMVILLFSVVTNSIKITTVYSGLDYLEEEEESSEIIPISKDGKNVVVLIVDRALGSEVPYIFNEKPELKEQFDGFTYYPNTVSFGGFTNTGIPAVYGGYEYTAEKINERADESLADKHDEALKVMPVLFEQNDYEVTVCDPVYAGYNWIPDLSVYEDYPEIRAYNTIGKFSASAPDDYVGPREIIKRNFFVHSLMKTAPLNWQFLLYNEGQYCNPNFNYVKGKESVYQSEGYDSDFLDGYLALKNLCQMTIFRQEKENTFLLFYNSTPHMPTLLQEPEYEPKKIVDNREYYTNIEERFTVDGVTLPMQTRAQVNHYDVNMATYIQIGKWLDYLKENNCYDNTRIIIVSDHGRDVHKLDKIDGSDVELEFFLPVLLVKDFDSEGFHTSEEFMTNADVAALATQDVVENRANPFSGNILDGHEKSGDLKLFFSVKRNPQDNPENVFAPGDWFSLNGNPNELGNWEYLGNY